MLELHNKMAPDPTSRARVPILEHGEPGEADYVVVIEPADYPVIMDYIETAFPVPELRPSNARQAVAVRMLEELLSPLEPWRMLIGKDTASWQNALKSTVQAMRNIDRCLQIYGEIGGDFLLGSKFSTAEVCAAPMLHRTFVWFKKFRDVDIKQLASELGLVRFIRWMDAVLARPSVLKTSLMSSLGLKRSHPDWALGNESLRYTISDGELVFP
eukprot:TRINITY_DN34749_c0_g1_i1.p1 TRINITY_DN34749_c0_g1~~TRINITY_DN34749_c0_g1_i1.p1  ORF type:complete len:214 (-),score=30.77 TRINITY_DN34749_c0_g1_i1:77-718(-)